MSGIIPAGKIDVPDAPDINPVLFLQQVIENISAQISLLDVEVKVAQQSGQGEIRDLYENIHEIKAQAESVRVIFQELSASAEETLAVNQQLEPPSDLLPKIRALTASLKELENELTAGEFDYYRIIAELLVDAQSQMAYFDAFGAIPHIKLLSDKLKAIQSELRRQVQWSFREIGQLVTSDSDSFEASEAPKDLSSLNQIYLVVDALGVHFRKDLLERFAQLQLIPYEKLYSIGSGSKVAGLEFLDRRFAWFKKLLAVAESRLSSFIPSSWQLHSHLFLEFCRRTKSHLADTLSKSERKMGTDIQGHVQTLLRAVRAVVTFDAEMKASFSVAARGADESEEGEGDEQVPVFMTENIADAFDPFMGPYVQLEREELDKMISKLMGDEEAGRAIEDEPPLKARDPFVSSRRLFEYIKKSVKRCSTFSSGNTYVSLSKEFRISLQHYAESLKFRCPSPTLARAGKPPVYVISVEQESTMCTIINTGEYCMDTVPQLEVIMKKHVQSAFIDEVDFNPEVDAFVDLVGYTIHILTQGILERVDPSLRKMRQTNWAAIDTVGDDSPYVKEMSHTLSDAVVRVRAALSSSCFQQFCMKLVTVVLDALLESTWKLKRIAKTGGGQLLLDLNGIKEYLLRMPNARLEAGREATPLSAAYKSVVNSRIQTVQVILKLVCTDDDKLNETFADLWPDGKQSDLDAVIALKAKTGLLAPVGDAIIGGASTVGRGAKSAVVDIKGAVGGLKSAFGEFSSVMRSGNLFADEGSSHGNATPKPTTSTAATNASTSGSGVKPKDKGAEKSMFTGVSSALGFKK